MTTKLVRLVHDVSEQKEEIDPYLLFTTKQKLKEEKLIDNKLRDTPPLDFSFKKICSLADDFSAKPREGRVGKIPNRSSNNKYLTRGLWLDNNFLVSTVGLEQFINNCLVYPNKLCWIDLSFNNIKEIYPEIVNFKNLLILYLHSNAIENFDTVVKLSELPNLKRLSLYGNPISDLPMYRVCMIQLIPKLTNLDFSPVIYREKNSILPLNLKKKYNLLSHI